MYAVRDNWTYVLLIKLILHVDHRYQTPLHFAAGSGHAEVVKILLEKNADINARGV